MRNISLIKNEYYLLKNSGVQSSHIFIDNEDVFRFIFLILHLQSPIVINNATWYVSSFLKKGRFGINPKTVNRIIKERQVELISFRIIPYEFSIIVHNLDDQISSVYMQRVLTGYSRYFNSKYKKRGHVFQGPFIANKIKKQELKNYINENHKVPEDYTLKFTSKDVYKTPDKSGWGDLLRIYR